MVIKNKRAQVTIFIIIAIIIVAAVIFLLWNRITVFFVPFSSPKEYIADCVSESVPRILNNLTEHGGSLNPENSLLYQDEERGYLCYTNQYYDRCTMQIGLLKDYVENNLKKEIKPKVDKCLNDFKEEMERRGYEVSILGRDFDVSIELKRVKIIINSQISLSKEDRTSFKNLEISTSSNVYTLLMIATSILNWEARYGDSDALTYMLYYPNLKVEKILLGDGSKIYILSDRENKERFVFATRSVAWHPGYGVGAVYEKP